MDRRSDCGSRGTGDVPGVLPEGTFRVWSPCAVRGRVGFAHRENVPCALSVCSPYASSVLIMVQAIARGFGGEIGERDWVSLVDWCVCVSHVVHTHTNPPTWLTHAPTNQHTYLFVGWWVGGASGLASETGCLGGGG